jgi:DNA invertase Pin-like site-specific DNA recombinase
MCRVVDTLLIDQEAVYAPRQGNDRLLLGLKGSLNEYELDLLRQRSLAARYEKARRGELVVAAPVGFIKRLDGRHMLALDGGMDRSGVRGR